MVQYKFQRASKSPQDRPMTAPFAFRPLQGGLQDLPSRLFASGGLLRPQDGSKLAQEGLKKAQQGPNAAPAAPKSAPRAPKEGTKRRPRGLK
eukprot:7838473-Pyramimonas_sp.AAC.1